MTILFRADASSTIGTGHIMRDLVLAQQYTNSKIYFATQELEGNLNDKIKKSGYEVIYLKNNNNNIDELNSIIKELNIDLLVIDHYEITYENEKELKSKNLKLKILSFDDTYEKHYCDVLLNHNISADEEKYKELVPSFCELRCGAEYTLLRDEFRVEKELKREKIYDFFVAMGGADTANLNIEILKILPENKRVALVTTNANKNLKELQAYVQNKKNILLFINSNEVAKLINQSRLAIITPSVTVNEVHFLDTPFIAIKTADNQEDIFNYLQENRYKVLSKFSDEALTNLLYRDKKLVNFTQLSLDEKKMILKWRNHERIRKWMFSSEVISLENHLNYIDTLFSKKDKVYFLLKQNNNYMGVINFTQIATSSAHIGLYANPNVKGRGMILMEEIIAYGFQTLKVQKLISEVFETNSKAIKLYEKFGFITVEKKENLLIMEFNNENR